MSQAVVEGADGITMSSYAARAAGNGRGIGCHRGDYDPGFVQRLTRAHKCMNSGGKRFPDDLLRDVRDSIDQFAGYERDEGAFVVTLDGPKCGGKTHACELLEDALDTHYGLNVYRFRDTAFSDDALVEELRAHKAAVGYSGNPFDMIAKLNAVRLSALTKPEVRRFFSDPKGVVLYERAYPTTLACKLAESLTGFNEFDTRADFMQAIIHDMGPAFFIPDLSLILHLGHQNMKNLVRQRSRVERRAHYGAFPPKAIGRAYHRFGAEIDSKGTNVLPNSVWINAGFNRTWGPEALKRRYQEIDCAILEAVTDALKAKGMIQKKSTSHK